MNNIGEQIKDRIAELGLSQKEVGYRTYLSFATVNKLCQGKPIMFDNLMIILDALDLEMNFVEKKK